MATLRVCLFGKFDVRSDTGVLGGLSGAKAQELFAYLLVRRARPHPREALAALLWGECPTAQSKKYLRQGLWQLQSALAAVGHGNDERPLLIDAEWVQVNARADVWLDVAMFEQAFAAVEGVAAEAIDGAQAQALQRAVELYRGDLLDGWYQDWCLFERERLQNMHVAMLDKLMGYCEARGHYEPAVTYGARILSHDRARERTHQRLMRLHFCAGDRAGALRQYERCAAALREELSVPPSERTTALRDQIRAGKLEPAHELPSVPVRADNVATQLSEALGRLRQFGTLLAGVESQVRQEIRVVERALKRVQPAASRRRRFAA